MLCTKTDRQMKSERKRGLKKVLLVQIVCKMQTFASFVAIYDRNLFPWTKEKCVYVVFTIQTRKFDLRLTQFEIFDKSENGKFQHFPETWYFCLPIRNQNIYNRKVDWNGWINFIVLELNLFICRLLRYYQQENPNREGKCWLREIP